MANAIDVNTTTGHICGDHHFNGTALKAFQCFHATRLRHITGNQTHFETLLLQTLIESATDVATVGKHHNALNIITFKNILQQGKLFTGGSDKDFLLDGIRSDALRLHLKLHWFIRPLLRQTHHVIGKGGGKQ